jgi:hypothetical protein
VILKLAPFDGQEIGHFGRIDDASAPDGDKHIAPFFLPGRHIFQPYRWWNWAAPDRSRRDLDGRGFESAFTFSTKPVLTKISSVTKIALRFPNGLTVSPRFLKYRRRKPIWSEAKIRNTPVTCRFLSMGTHRTGEQDQTTTAI